MPPITSTCKHVSCAFVGGRIAFSKSPSGLFFSKYFGKEPLSAIVEMWKTPIPSKPQVTRRETLYCPEVINILIHNKLGYFEVNPQLVVCRSYGENGVPSTVQRPLGFVDKGPRGYNFNQLISCIRLQ